MPYIGNQPSESFTSFATQEFSTSATTSYTLDHAVTNENEIALFVNNVRQQPGSGKAYTATGTALTLSAATASTDTMYCVFLGRALQTVTPATNSITAAMVGNDLISGKTALGATPADTDELLISDAGTLKRVDYSYLKAANTPAFAATRTSNQSASSANAITKVQADVEIFDTDSAYDNSTNYRFTPQVAGKYLIYAKLYMDSSDHSAAMKLRSIIYKNGSLYTASQLDFRNNYGGYDNSVMNQAVIDMNGSSDYVEAYFQIVVNSGTGLLAAGTKSIEFGGYKLF